MQVKTELGHVAIHAQNPGHLAAFYADFLGFHKVGRFESQETGEMVMMSSRPKGAQELAFVGNAQAKHLAFRVDSLGELRQLHSRALERQVPVLMAFDHGITFSFYFLDPEGNGCEAFWETGRPPRNTNRPIDLTMEDDELLQLITT